MASKKPRVVDIKSMTPSSALVKPFWDQLEKIDGKLGSLNVYVVQGYGAPEEEIERLRTRPAGAGSAPSGGGPAGAGSAPGAGGGRSGGGA